LVGGVLGAVNIMVSPATPWTGALATVGAALVVVAVAVLLTAFLQNRA
jgi:hypothetical protein